MKSAEKYALRFSKAMKTLGRDDHKKLGAAFLRRYSAYLDSEEYKGNTAQPPADAFARHLLAIFPSY